jgi:hypothetical protein
VGRGDYERLTPGSIDRVWGRLRAGQAAKPTARELGLCTGTVRAYLLRCGAECLIAISDGAACGLRLRSPLCKLL